MKPIHRISARYGLALLLISLAVWVRWALLPLPGFMAPYLAVYPAIVFISTMLGLGPGLLASGCGVLATEVWLLTHNGAFSFGIMTIIRVILVIGSAAYLGYISRRLRLAEARAREDAENARAAQHQAAESEKRYRSLFENSTDAIFMTTPDGGVTAANPAACAMFGMTEGELCRAGRRGIVDPDESRLESALAERARTGRFQGELSYLRKGGTRLLAEVSSVILPGDEPDSFVIMHDITKRKHAEAALRESEERFRAAFENGAIAMAMTALDSSLLEVNTAFRQMLGYSEAELAGCSFSSITHPDDVAQSLSGIQCLLKGDASSYRMEKRYMHKDGRILWGDMCTALVRDTRGRPLYFVTHIQDITERKRAEDALREADRRKDEFLAMLAHELRNPLAPIRNAVHILRALGTRELAIQRQYDTIDRQVTHMAHLLDDLLDVARITRDKIDLKRQFLTLSDILLQVVETIMPLLRTRRHTLCFDPSQDELYVEGDPDRLSQVVGNLLINAAKYTEENGQIWLLAQREDNHAVIRVRDTGIGIAPEMLPRVFDLFTQADQSLDRSQGGLGIGLTMVKRLVEMHGGTVEARSDGLGQGSEFIVKLPLLMDGPHDAEKETPVVQRAEEAPAPARRVLVVDDLVDTAQSLCELLQLWGHQVCTAHSGAAAVEAACAFQPEVVLLDIGMPGMDGFEVARRLRQYPETAGALLVAVTGYGQDSDREQTRAAGFDEHLAKPVDLRALQELLAQKV